MSIAPRRIASGLLSLLMIGSLLVILMDLARDTVNALTVIDILAPVVFAGPAWRRWANAPYARISLIRALASSTINEPYLTQQFSGGIWSAPRRRARP